MSMHYIKAVFRVGGKILFDYFAWMRKYSKHPEKYPYELRYQKLRKLLVKLSNAMDVEYHVEGLENLPEGKCLIICNHLAAYDPLALISIMEKPVTFVAKKELTKAPFVGRIIKSIEGLFIDRKDLKQSLRVMMKVEESLKGDDIQNWMIYPEGTRNKDPMKNMNRFHHGTFRPGTKAGVPIVPVAIYGTFRVLKAHPDFKKYPVHIKILKPVMPDEYESIATPDLAAMVQGMIQREVDFDLRKKDHLEMKKIGSKHYRFNQIL